MGNNKRDLQAVLKDWESAIALTRMRLVSAYRVINDTSNELSKAISSEQKYEEISKIISDYVTFGYGDVEKIMKAVAEAIGYSEEGGEK